MICQNIRTFDSADGDRQEIELQDEEHEQNEKHMNLWIQWSCKTIHIAYSGTKHGIQVNDTNNGDSNAIERYRRV